MACMTYRQALEQVLYWLSPSATEYVPIHEADGRILAQDCYSQAEVPNADYSLRDGYALRSSELIGCSKEHPVSLGVVGHSAAGQRYDKKVQAGHCVRIMTGAVIPDELDAVVAYEEVAINAGDGSVGSIISYGWPLEAGRYIRHKGQDAQPGDLILKQGSQLDPAAIGALGAAGLRDVLVYSKPKVAIIPLGNELVALDDEPKSGQVRNSNLLALCAYANQAGGQALPYYIVHDEPFELSHAINECSTQADLVVIVGGSSKGDFDFADTSLRNSGQLIYSELALRPGQSQGFGLVNSTPVFSLPGVPHAAFLSFELMVRPAIRKAAGFKHVERLRLPVRLAHDIPKVEKHPDDSYYIPVKLRLAADAVFEAWQVDKQQQSALLSGAHGCQGILEISPGLDRAKAGSTVSCLLLDEQLN